MMNVLVVTVVPLVAVVVVVAIIVAGLVIKKLCARSNKVFDVEDIERATYDNTPVSIDTEVGRHFSRLDNTIVDLHLDNTIDLELGNERAKPDSNFDKFITKRVVPKFEKIRELGRYQFAVLILVSHNKKLQDVTFTPLLPNAPCCNQPWPPIIPEPPQVRNYIAARPEYRYNVHSEVKILECFKRVWNTNNRHTTPYKQIILYSWTMPCETCTHQIIQTFNNKQLQSSVTIAYTIEYRKETVLQAKENRHQLEQYGFNVRHVEVDYRLPQYCY